MKKALTRILISATLGVSLIAATPQPLTVLSTLDELLAKAPIRGETVIVLGGSAAFDNRPISIAKHYKPMIYPTNGITGFPALDGGGWYVVALGGSSSAGPLNEVVLSCLDDGTVHSMTVYETNGFYVLTIDQSPSVAYPSSVYIESSDGSSHRLLVSKHSDTGVYAPAVAQGSSTVTPSPLVLVAPDTSEHNISITNMGGIHTFLINQ